MNTTAPQLRRTAGVGLLPRAVRLSGRRAQPSRSRPAGRRSRLALVVRGRDDDLPGTERNTSLSEIVLRPFSDVHSLHR